MINELSQLSAAMQKANIATVSWHRKYLSIPNITQKNPCVRIVIDDSRVLMLESLSPEKGKQIRKYGDNQGSFPAMNLTPLYRIKFLNGSAWIQNPATNIHIYRSTST